MRESAIERKVVAYCKARGVLCYKFVSPGRSGVPDRLILHKGRAMFLELKAPGMEPSDLQAHEMVRLARDGGCVVGWSDSYEMAEAQIDRFLNA